MNSLSNPLRSDRLVSVARRVACSILLALLLPAAGFADDAVDAWQRWSDARLLDEQRHLETRLRAAIDGLQEIAEELETAYRENGPALTTDPLPVFRFLNERFGRDPELMGLPLGIQLIREGEALAWTGWPVPVGPIAGAAAEAGPLFQLRDLGIYQFLTVRAPLAGTEAGQWRLDLPLARRSEQADGDHALPVLFAGPAAALSRLVLLPPQDLAERAPGLIPTDDLSWTVTFRSLPEGADSEEEGMQRCWQMLVGDRPMLDVCLRGPTLESFLHQRRARRRLLLGALALFVTAALGLLLRQRLLQDRPQGLALAWRALFIATLVLALRWLLVFAGWPRYFFEDSSFWNPRGFALAGLGGCFASTGEFLISALAALAILVLVLRPYLRPEAMDAQADLDLEDLAAPTNRLEKRQIPILALGLLSPLLGVLAADAFARLIYNNTETRLLFQARFLDLDLIGLGAALFFALAFLLALFLAPAQQAWRGLALGRRVRWPFSLLTILAVAILVRPSVALALLLVLPVAWGFRRAATRLTGLVYHLFFIVLAVTVLSEGAAELARRDHLADYLADRAAARREQVDIWQQSLVGELLMELGRDESLRRSLLRPPEMDTWTALSLWRRYGLQEMNLEGSLEIYDSRSRLRSHFEQGLEFSVPLQRPIPMSEMPDLWVMVEQKEQDRGVGGQPYWRGELVMKDGAEQLGTLILNLAGAPETLAREFSVVPWHPASLLGHDRVLPGDERLFLARLDGERIVESSAPTLLAATGLHLPRDDGRWERRRLGDRVFRIALLEEGAFLAGYRDASRLDKMLAGSLRLFLHLVLLVLLLLLDVIFSRVRLVRRYVPPLIGPRGLGFQHKLLGAFLLVALLPTVLTGIIAGRQISRQYDEASLRSSLERVLSARRSLANATRQEAQDLARSEYVQNFVLPDFPPTVRDIGSLEHSRIMIFNTERQLLLDETLRNWSQAQVDSFLSVLPRERVVFERDESRLYAGILLPLEFWRLGQRAVGWVYYRKTLTEDLLADLAEVIGGDLNLYREGTLLHSNQPLLFGLGFQSALLDPQTVAELLEGKAAYRQSVGQAGKLRYGQAALPLSDATGEPVAILSSLDFSNLASQRLAQDQRSSVVYSMIAFLIVLALGLGGFLAGRVFLPIRRLQRGTRRLAAGELSYRLPPLGRDEIGELVRSFNTMAGELQDAQRDIEERQSFLEGVLENVAAGVLTLDADGRVRSANSAARGLLDLESEALLGRSLGELESAAADSAPLFRYLAQTLGDADTRARQLELAGPEGARSFRVASSDLAGGRVAVFEDVTDLIRSQKLSAWGEMARQVAHEIKNPLTPIKLSAQYMERAWRDRKPDFELIFTDSVRTITEQVEILRHIAQEFSLYGRRAQMRPAPLDLAVAMREVVQPYTGSGLELRWSREESLLVMADAEGLRKVLLNLVENAREAMGGAGLLEIACERSGEFGELLMRDHGTGIPEEMLERLYEPYFSTKTAGTGLGLAISAQLAEEMGGSLRLENHPEGGAQARLRLRLAP